jgi:predicted nucleic acid-binding protein
VTVSSFTQYEVLNGLVNLFVRGAREEYIRRTRDYDISIPTFRDQHPDLVKRLFPAIEAAQRAVYMLLRSFPNRVRELPTNQTVRVETLRLMREHGLYPGDATHAATASVHGVPDIVTLDYDFDALPASFTIWKPEPMIRKLRRA